MFVLLGLIVMGAGVVRLAFPQITRGLDRFSNELEGVETRQGELYELGRVISGGAMIVGGLLIMFMG